MAKIDTSPKHGSVGWSTFVNGPHGLIEKQRTRPRNPKTLAQQLIRSRVAAYAAGWRHLSEAQRAGWRALAGQLPGPLGGCQLYIKLNVTRSTCGLHALTEAPPPPAFGILVCTGLVVEDTPAVRLIQVTDTLAPEAFIVEASPPLSAGLQSAGHCFRQLLVVPGHAGAGVDIDLTAAYTARFGAPAAGQRVFVRLSAMKDGFKDTAVQFSALVAAAKGEHADGLASKAPSCQS